MATNNSLFDGTMSEVFQQLTHVKQLLQEVKDLLSGGGGAATVEEDRASIMVEELPNVSRLLPNLSFGLRKGACGKIGIVGGSADNTGAPFFAAISSVKLGADLVHVYCPPEAAPVIKGYSPELMVHPHLNEEKTLLEGLKSLDAIVLGPGLGRDPSSLQIVKSVLSFAKEKQVPTVIDADGLWFICDLLDFIHGTKTFFLTPNIIELHRMVEKATGESDLDRYNQDPSYISQKGLEFVNKTGVSLYIKAKDDLIICPGWTEPVFGKVEGSPRRCGGQGDITSGVLGVFYFWSKKEFEKLDEGMKIAGLAAHELVREAAKEAFMKYGRSVTAGGMIEEICPILMKLDEF